MPYAPGDTILKYMGIKLEEVKKELSLLAIGNEEYAKFNARIVNTNKTVLGVRVPALRKYAKLLARDSSFDDIKKYIDSIDSNVFEQTLLAGMLINSSKLPDREKIVLAKQYLKSTYSPLNEKNLTINHGGILPVNRSVRPMNSRCVMAQLK